MEKVVKVVGKGAEDGRVDNFVVIGPYKQKQDAARVVKELTESHGVRGWMMAGN
jgi:cell division protein FtsN